MLVSAAGGRPAGIPGTRAEDRNRLGAVGYPFKRVLAAMPLALSRYDACAFVVPQNALESGACVMKPVYPFYE